MKPSDWTDEQRAAVDAVEEKLERYVEGGEWINNCSLCCYTGHLPCRVACPLTGFFGGVCFSYCPPGQVATFDDIYWDGFQQGNFMHIEWAKAALSDLREWRESDGER